LEEREPEGLHIKANLIAGVLTIIPILVVWIVLSFVFDILFRVGAPMERALIDWVGEIAPSAEPVLSHPLFEWCIAIVVALLVLYTIGGFASHVVGDRLIAAFESLIDRIPGVQLVYSASKRLIAALQPPPGARKARIMLFDFPYKGVKVICLVMKTFNDTKTGEENAVIYVPTAPNPTSGYLLIVPFKVLVPTDMSMDEAMTMIISGGSLTPDRLTLAAHPMEQPPAESEASEKSSPEDAPVAAAK
jgi:uncharacterized membrane protein